MDSSEEYKCRVFELYKLEIDLYWKRSTFCWAIVASFFAGFLLLTNNKENVDRILVLLTAVIGFLVTYSWFLMNIGGKHWIDFFKIGVDITSYEYALFDNKHYFSVTRINLSLSGILSFIWVALIVYSNFGLDWRQHRDYIAGLIIDAFMIFSVFLITYYSRFDTDTDPDSKQLSKSKKTLSESPPAKNHISRRS